MKTLNLVEYVLLNNTKARNSDLELIISVWAEQGLHLSDLQKEILKSKCSKPETIRRLRQKFQEQGKYLADKTVEQARYNKYIETKHSVGVANPTETDEVLSRAVYVGLDQ